MNFRKLPSRRVVIGGLAAAGGVAILERQLIGSALAGLVSDPSNLKTGDYTWQPQRSPSGPVVIIVSLPEQRVYVYRNGVEIAVSTCSTGKPGHDTPTGVFTILQKDKHHRSSTYNNAPMPNLNRLTWKGIALHAGKLPGYPASHGCVRLPLAFSEKLFGVTHLGTPVIIANARSHPASIVHPGQILTADANAEFRHVAAVEKATPPSARPVNQISMAPAAADVPAPHIRPHDYEEAAKALAAARAKATREKPATPQVVPSTTILVSSADRRIMVLDNGEIVAEGLATIAEPGKALGHHVFVLSNVNQVDGQLRWNVLGYAQTSDPYVPEADLGTIQRIRAPHEVVEAIRTRMLPGTMMVTVDQPLQADTRSARDFTVVTSGIG